MGSVEVSDMPCKIPAHIFDIDEATAERIERRIIQRRLRNRLLVAVVCLAAATASALAAAL